MLNDIMNEILKSKKYADIDRNVIERLGNEIIPKYPKRKEIVKAIKKELHIIHESFLQENCHSQADQLISCYSGNDLKSDKELSLKLMLLHSSTKERLTEVSEIYAFISKYINKTDKIIDIGCGFNPFALPFLMEKPENYRAYDINLLTIQLLNKYFKSAGLKYQAELLDAANKSPDSPADVLFAFKLFPLLERQKKGRAFALLTELDCCLYIISFPLKSASGKEKGMESFYSAFFENELPSGFSIIEKQLFYNEMFYVVKKDMGV